MNSPSSAIPPEEKPRKGPFRRILRWIFRTALLAVLLALILVGVLPLLVSAFAGKTAVESLAGDHLAAPLSVESVSMNWTGGLGVKDLRIDQPSGFGPGAAVEIREALLDVGLGKLLAGVYKVGIQVKGLRVALVRNKDGALNLGALVKPAPGEETSHPKPEQSAPSSPGKSPLADLQAWFRLEDATLEVKDLSQGLSGKILLDLTAGNEKPGGPIRIQGKGRLFTGEGNPGGVVDIQGTLDPLQRKGVVHVRGDGMALETWKALLPASGQISGLKGNLGLNMEIRLEKNRLQTKGKIELRDLAARLSALGGAPIRQSLWVLQPDLAVDLEKKEVDFSGLRASAGPLGIQGLPAAKAAELLGGKKGAGTLLTLDLGKLPRLPGLLPRDALLAGKISLEAALPEETSGEVVFRLKGQGLTFSSRETKAGPFRLEGSGGIPMSLDLSRIHSLLTIQGQGLLLGENMIRDVLARLSLKGGKLQALLEKAEVNGGPAKGSFSLALGKDTIPVKAALHLKGASVNTSLAPALAYVLPFAVTPKDALLSGKAGIDLDLAGDIPTKSGLSLRKILEGFRGGGDLAFQSLSFQGSPALKQVLGAFRAGKGYLFKGLATHFRLDGGRIIQKEIVIPHGGSKVRISGFTDLAGNLDYSFDFSDLLQKNKKGRKLLALLGGNTLPLKLKGTIFSPKPEFKALDLKSLLGTGKQAIQKKAEGALEKGLMRLFGKHRKKKKKK